MTMQNCICGQRGTFLIGTVCSVKLRLPLLSLFLVVALGWSSPLQSLIWVWVDTVQQLRYLMTLVKVGGVVGVSFV